MCETEEEIERIHEAAEILAKVLHERVTIRVGHERVEYVDGSEDEEEEVIHS
jgi:hypothetical protein